jgi:hypothetical protein
MRCVSEEEPERIRSVNPDIPAWLESLCERLMAKNPDDRFQSASEVAGLLESYLAHLRQPTTMPTPELPAPAVRRKEKKPAGRPEADLPFRYRVYFGVNLLLVGLAVALLLVAQLPDDSRRAEEGVHDVLVHDFRGGILPVEMAPFGPQAANFLKPDPEGVRFFLPRNRITGETVGLQMPLALGGDFEITTTFEILHADEPRPEMYSYGVGPLLSVNEAARIGRLCRAGSEVLTWDRWVFNGAERRLQVGAVACPEKVLRLRLKRTKRILHFLWARGTVGEEFEEIQSCTFGTDEITLLRLEMNSNGRGRAGELDVRVRDLKIRAGTAGPIVPEGGTSQPRRWLVAAGIIGVMLVGSLGVCLAVLWRQRGRKPAVPRPAGKADTASAPGASVRCSGCRRLLKSKPDLAGKQAKCPHCATPVQVPGIRKAT